jgi:hypothetical protein
MMHRSYLFLFWIADLLEFFQSGLQVQLGYHDLSQIILFFILLFYYFILFLKSRLPKAVTAIAHIVNQRSGKSGQGGFADLRPV